MTEEEPKESRMEAVECECGNVLLMKAECDFDDLESETWRFDMSVTWHDPLNDCCKERIRIGMDNCIQSVIWFKSVAEIDRNYEINFELPEDCDDRWLE